MFSEPQQLYVDINAPFAVKRFSDALYGYVKGFCGKSYRDIVILCIGTDRSAGDSLGPLVGYKLKSMKYDRVHVHGSLEDPVHAKNIRNTVDYIYQGYEKPLVIAVDACLGRVEHVGFISVARGSIKPGSGINKVLPEVGDISIIGIVNFSGPLDFFILQNTRLSVVMKMADTIAVGLRLAMRKVNENSCISLL